MTYISTPLVTATPVGKINKRSNCCCFEYICNLIHLSLLRKKICIIYLQFEKNLSACCNDGYNVIHRKQSFFSVKRPEWILYVVSTTLCYFTFYFILDLLIFWNIFCYIVLPSNINNIIKTTLWNYVFSSIKWSNLIVFF